MRWAGEMGVQAGQAVTAIASVCAPLDLVASGLAIGRGFNRLVFKFRATETENKKLKEKIAGFEGSEPTGGGDGGGSPTGGKKEDSWESKLDKLAR